MRTAIIVLNWNGFGVLRECMESLMPVCGDFFVVVADNASDDGSVQKLSEWCKEHGFSHTVVKEGEENGVVAAAKDIVIYSLKENYGFAKGNNMAAKLALQSQPQRVLLLNNDTEVEPDFLTKLEDFQNANPDCQILTPLIFYGYDKTKIWNAGGKLSFGFRKYYYAGKTAADIREKGFIPISFVTGCALYVPTSLLYDGDKVLTERFFFGEEDFEFSMRMNANGVRMACVLDSVIYHKVGSSGSRMFASGKLYLHYLNRFIDIRLHKSALFYTFWTMLNVPFCLRHFYKSSGSVKKAFGLLRNLLSDARRKQSVTKEDFNALVINNTYFNKI